MHNLLCSYAVVKKSKLIKNFTSKAFDPVTNSTLPVAPCGAIANSMFNDTFELECLVENGPSVFVPLLNTGIAWESDKGQKFKNPSGVGSLELRFQVLIYSELSLTSFALTLSRVFFLESFFKQLLPSAKHIIQPQSCELSYYNYHEQVGITR